MRSLALCLALSACGGASSAPPMPAEADQGALADLVLAAPLERDGPYGDPERAVNGVRGGGLNQGSLDVYQLGLGELGYLDLGWSDRVLVDGPGVDLVIFENAFQVAGGGAFFDPLFVSVSPDGERWVQFPTAYLGPEATFSEDPSDWQGFAGLAPVLLNLYTHPAHGLAPEAGGDRFDLADLPEADPITAEVLAGGAVAVRLQSAGGLPDPETGLPLPLYFIGDGADIDGIAGRTVPLGP